MGEPKKEMSEKERHDLRKTHVSHRTGEGRSQELTLNSEQKKNFIENSKSKQDLEHNQKVMVGKTTRYVNDQTMQTALEQSNEADEKLLKHKNQFYKAAALTGAGAAVCAAVVAASIYALSRVNFTTGGKVGMSFLTVAGFWGTVFLANGASNFAMQPSHIQKRLQESKEKLTELRGESVGEADRKGMTKFSAEPGGGHAKNQGGASSGHGRPGKK